MSIYRPRVQPCLLCLTEAENAFASPQNIQGSGRTCHPKDSNLRLKREHVEADKLNRASALDRLRELGSPIRSRGYGQRALLESWPN